MPDEAPTTILSEVANNNPAPQTPNPAPAPNGEAPQRPAYVPEKFWSPEKGAADVEKMGSAYLTLEKEFHAKKGTLTPPLPGDPPEKIEAFTAELRKLTGAPDKPEGYDIKPPEQMPDGIKWDEEGAKAFQAAAHKHGVSPAAVKDFLSIQQASMQRLVEGAKGTVEQRMQAAKAELQGEWKESFKANAEAAVKAAKTLGVDMSDPEIGNNPKVIKAMYQSSLLMREDKLIGGDGASGKTNAELIEEIRRSDAYNGKQGKDMQTQAANRLAALYGAKT